MVGHLLNSIGHYEHFLWYLMDDLGWSKKVLEKLGPVKLDILSAGDRFGNGRMTPGKECFLERERERERERELLGEECPAER